jgi:hypothetical protein
MPPPLSGFEELLRPAAVEALRDALAPVKFRDRDFAAQAIEDDADFFFRRILLAGRPANIADQAFRRTVAPAAGTTFSSASHGPSQVMYDYWPEPE